MRDLPVLSGRPALPSPGASGAAVWCISLIRVLLLPYASQEEKQFGKTKSE